MLREFRKHCDVLVSVGDCAIMGGIPAMRNTIPLAGVPGRGLPERARPCTTPAGSIPNDPELPLLLDKVYPCHEVVKIDYFLPGCPPSADTLWEALTALLAGKPHRACPTS